MKTVLTISCLAFTLISYSQVAVEKSEQKINPKVKKEVREVIYASELKKKPVTSLRVAVPLAPKPKEAVLSKGSKEQ